MDDGWTSSSAGPVHTVRVFRRHFHPLPGALQAHPRAVGLVLASTLEETKECSGLREECEDSLQKAQMEVF